MHRYPGHSLFFRPDVLFDCLGLLPKGLFFSCWGRGVCNFIFFSLSLFLQRWRLCTLDIFSLHSSICPLFLFYFPVVCFLLSTYSKHLSYMYCRDISIDGIYRQSDNLVYMLRKRYLYYMGNLVYINSCLCEFCWLS